MADHKYNSDIDHEFQVYFPQLNNVIAELQEKINQYYKQIADAKSYETELEKLLIELRDLYQQGTSARKNLDQEVRSKIDEARQWLNHMNGGFKMEEDTENKGLNLAMASNSNLMRSSSEVAQGDVVSFLQCLPLDPEVMASNHQKASLQGDFEQHINACLDISANVPEEIERVKAGLCEGLDKARERSKIFNETLSIFDKYFPNVPSETIATTEFRKEKDNGTGFDQSGVQEMEADRMPFKKLDTGDTEEPGKRQKLVLHNFMGSLQRSTTSKKFSVLVVASKRLDQVLYKRLFNQFGKEKNLCWMEVQVALNVDDAVDSHRHGAVFDLILMDMEMCGKNGSEAAKELRAKGVGARIVGVTSAIESEQKAFVEAGLDSCVEKPLMLDKIASFLPSPAGHIDNNN